MCSEKAAKPESEFKGVEFYWDSGANIHSCKREFISWDDLGMTEEEWDELDDDCKDEFLKDCMNNHWECGYEKTDGNERQGYWR